MIKTKQLLITIFLISSLILLPGCSNNNQDVSINKENTTSTSTSIPNDLLNYINNELPKIAQVETIVTDGYNNLIEEEYIDNFTIFKILSDSIIPNSRKLIEEAELIQPSTKEVREIHELYINAITQQDSAFTLMLSALENQDYEVLTKANEKLNEGRKAIRDYTYEIESLAKSNNVILEFNE